MSLSCVVCYILVTHSTDKIKALKMCTYFKHFNIILAVNRLCTTSPMLYEPPYPLALKLGNGKHFLYRNKKVNASN